MGRKMSAEYWSTPNSSEYDALIDRLYTQGMKDAQNGLKPRVKKLLPGQRTFYMAAYNRYKVS